MIVADRPDPRSSASATHTRRRPRRRAEIPRLRVPGRASHPAHWLAEDPAQRRILTLADAHYPQALLEAPDPPLMLWLMGQVVGLPPAQ